MKRLLFIALVIFGCEKDTTTPPSIPGYVGEYDLTKVIFTCGDEQGLSAEGPNMIDGELICTSAEMLFSMYIYDYENILTDCFVGTNNEGIFALYDSEILSFTLDGAIEQIVSDTLKVTSSDGSENRFYWNKIGDNLIVKEIDGWEYYFEEKED